MHLQVNATVLAVMVNLAKNGVKRRGTKGTKANIPTEIIETLRDLVPGTCHEISPALNLPLRSALGDL
jgi:hypothetical protein